MPETNAIFSEFLKDLDPKVKHDFINALDEAELFDFCGSKEEFAVVTGRDPKREMRKMPDLQDDVKEPEITLEEIQERFDKFMRAFPQEKSLRSLKDLAMERTQPPAVQVTINLNQMRERSGQEAPKSAE